jgi:hypothetical protein
MKLTKFVLAALAALLVGCASNDPWQGESLPLPTTTPFDANPFARRAYLDGFASGYRATQQGGVAGVDLISGPHRQARKMGYEAGAASARAENAR